MVLSTFELKKKVNYNSLIGISSCRKVYVCKDASRCMKVALRERLKAGQLQNEMEFLCFNTETRGLSKCNCFPTIFSHNEDFSMVEVERCKSMSLDEMNSLFKPYVTAEFIHSISSKRIDKCKQIPIAGSAMAWFAFVFGEFLENSIRNAVISVKLRSYDMYASIQSVEQLLDITARNFSENIGCFSQNETSIARSSIGFLRSMIENKDTDKLMRSLYDLVSFFAKVGYSAGFLFADLWNATQWGLSQDGFIKILDYGYSYLLANSKHYKRSAITPLDANVITVGPGCSPSTFNNECLSEIRSPSDTKVISKFYTLSEYILAEDGRSRHIKKQGTKDDGLWPWSDKMMFIEYGKLVDLMNAMNEYQLVAKKISFEDNSLSISIPASEDNEWKEICRIDDVQYAPKIGLNVCEFNFDSFDGKSGIMKSYHPGHSVVFIENGS